MGLDQLHRDRLQPLFAPGQLSGTQVFHNGLHPVQLRLADGSNALHLQEKEPGDETCASDAFVEAVQFGLQGNGS